MSFELLGGIALGLLFAIGLCLFRNWFRVEQGHVAVLQNFGAVVRDCNHVGGLRIFRPGIHFKWPWQAAVSISVMERVVNLAGESGGVTAMAADGSILRLDSKLRFQINEDELSAFVFSLRRPTEHVLGLFKCLLRNEVANYKPNKQTYGIPGHSVAPAIHMAEVDASSYAALRSDRQRLNGRIRDFCLSQLERGYGVHFKAVDLIDICPPPELENALNAVFESEAQARANYSRAESEAQRHITAATRGVEIARTEAQARKTEMSATLSYLKILHNNGTLAHYLKRRRSEVRSQFKTLFLRSAT